MQCFILMLPFNAVDFFLSILYLLRFIVYSVFSLKIISYLTLGKNPKKENSLKIHLRIIRPDSLHSNVTKLSVTILNSILLQSGWRFDPFHELIGARQHTNLPFSLSSYMCVSLLSFPHTFFHLLHIVCTKSFEIDTTTPKISNFLNVDVFSRYSCQELLFVFFFVLFSHYSNFFPVYDMSYTPLNFYCRFESFYWMTQMRLSDIL